MTRSILQIKVRDFDTWLPFMEEFADMRKVAGSRGTRIFQSANDATDLVVISEWDDLDDAQKSIDSPALATVIQRADVLETASTICSKLYEFEY